MFQAGSPLMPRGALSIASYLNHRGIRASLFPLNNLPSPAFIPGFNDAGIIAQTLQPVIKDLNPRVIGLSCPYSYLYPLSLRILKTVRELAPHAVTVLGGPHVTYDDENCLLHHDWVDVVVRSEGEWTMADLCTAVAEKRNLSSVQGISFRDGPGGPEKSVIRRTGNRPLGNLTELPALDFGLLPRKMAGEMLCYGILSRGCAFRCAFCHEARFWQGKVRRYDVSQFIEELETLHFRYNNQMMSIDDSMLSMKSRTWHALIAGLKASEVRLREDFSMVTRADAVTPEGLEEMRSIGIEGIVVGVETASPRVARMMNKKLNLEKVIEAARLARKNRIKVSTFWIIGHPGDTPIEAEKTYRFLCSLYRDNLTTSSDPAMFIPYPGTIFYDAPETYGIEILTHDFEHWIRGNQPVIRLRDFPEQDIHAWYNKFFRLSSQVQKLEHGLTKRQDGLVMVAALLDAGHTSDKAQAWREAINALYPEHRITLFCRKDEIALELSADLEQKERTGSQPPVHLSQAGLELEASGRTEMGLRWYRAQEMTGNMLVRLAVHRLLQTVPPLS